MRFSLRFWQTALFICVTLVAMLILYQNLVSSLTRTVEETSRNQLRREVTSLADQIADHLPAGADITLLENDVRSFVDVFGRDVWVYGPDDQALVKINTKTQPGKALEQVERGALSRKTAVSSVFWNQGLEVAATPIIRSDRLLATVVIASNGEEAIHILSEAKYQLAVAFAIALLASALLGFAFSEVIARQVRHLTRGAQAIAQGDFSQRLKGLVPDEVGELTHAFNMMAEKLGRAFDVLNTQRQEISTVINTISEGLIEVDGEGNIRIANPAAAEVFGFEGNDLLGAPLEIIGGCPELVEGIARAARGDDVVEVFQYRERIVLMHARPLPDNGGAGGAVLILRDVTREKRMEQAQRDFISNASHELRTPVASLKGYLELLHNGAMQKEDVRDHFLSQMRAVVTRLQHLLDDLFTLAQIDVGRIELSLEKEQAADIVSEVGAVAEPLAAVAGLELITESVSDLGLVLCDRNRIVEVLVGFVDNALKHTGKGGIVTIFARKSSGGVSFGVSDTGAGIERDVLPRIFDRFFTERSSRGSGLGLSIAREIIEAHESRISVDSAPRLGTTFSFELPAVSATDRSPLLSIS